MTYATEQILRDVDGKPIPQGWDEVGGVYRPLPVDANGLLVNSEQPAAVAASDALANPTAPQVLAHLMGWDGTEAQRARFSDTTNFNLQVAIRNGSTQLALENNNGDAIAASATNKRASTASVPTLFNGTSFDRERNNNEGTALASAVRAATTASADFTNYNHRGVLIWVDITAVPGTDTVQFEVQGKDPVSGKYATLVQSSAIATITTNLYAVYPGATAGGAGRNPLPLPRTWRVVATHSAASNFTYSVGYALIV